MSIDSGLDHREVVFTGMEKEKNEPTIRFEIFRHDDKAKATTSGDRTGDEFVRITEKGRTHATEVGKSKNPQAENAVAYGSTRERAIETALRHMLADQEEITPDMTLEDIRAKVAEQLTHGKKDIMTDRLNFNWDGTKEFHDVAYEHYLKNKDALLFLLEESDVLAEKSHDAVSTSYSRSAGNVAELVKKYLDILPTWNRVAGKNPEKYKKFHNELQRFMGSHQTVTESFLMKVIEKTKGTEAVKEFVAKMPDKNGFGLSEGFSVVISTEGDRPVASVTFKNETWTIDSKVLDEIIKDRDSLNARITSERPAV